VVASASPPSAGQYRRPIRTSASAELTYAHPACAIDSFALGVVLCLRRVFTRTISSAKLSNVQAGCARLRFALEFVQVRVGPMNITDRRVSYGSVRGLPLGRGTGRMRRRPSAGPDREQGGIT
jgi:hypothetical protein